jgi:hypothetical protein
LNRISWHDLLCHLQRQCILGDEEFVEKLKPALKDKAEVKEIPRNDRFSFQPALSELLA